MIWSQYFLNCGYVENVFMVQVEESFCFGSCLAGQVYDGLSTNKFKLNVNYKNNTLISRWNGTYVWIQFKHLALAHVKNEYLISSIFIITQKYFILYLK